MRRLAVFLAIFLTRCGGLKSTLGLDHNGPNEFDSVPLSPLSLPQDFNKTPKTEQKTKKKTGQKAFPFAFETPSEEPQTEEQKVDEAPQKKEETNVPEKEVSAQNILLGETLDAKDSAQTQPTTPSPKASTEEEKGREKSKVQDEVDFQTKTGESRPSLKLKAISRPILSRKEEREDPEEKPLNWTDQEAILNNTWAEISPAWKPSEAKLQILDNEVTLLGQTSVPPSIPASSGVSKSPLEMPMNPVFDKPAKVPPSRTPKKAGLGSKPTFPFPSDTFQQEARPFSRPQGMTPILGFQKNKHSSSFHKQSKLYFSVQKAGGSLQQTAPSIRRPDPSPEKTTMQPIFFKRTKCLTRLPQKRKRNFRKKPRRRVQLNMVQKNPSLKFVKRSPECVKEK